MNRLVLRIRAILGRPAQDQREQQLSQAQLQTVADFAYQQADLLRDQQVTREQALTTIAARFPDLTPKQNIASACSRPV